MARFYLPTSVWQSQTSLVGDEARHLTQVLRIKCGEHITVFDGNGRRAEAEILSASRDHVNLKLGEPVQEPRSKPLMTLVQAIPKGKNMDWIVQKAVELGVSEIQPVVTKRTVVQPGDHKSEKWQRVALEACKQCGQDVLPIVQEPLTWQAWLGKGKATEGLKLIASLAPGAKPLKDILRAHPHTEQATVLIGPEGDFSPDETQQALEAGFLPISLGHMVLRVETATLFCLSALRYEYTI